MPDPLPRPAAPNPEGDAYADLLSRTRGLLTEHRAQRDRWFSDLPLDNKEELLFELEVILKATACFANPRNHPGPAKRTSIVAQDFREATTLLRDGMTRGIQLIRQLLGERDRAYVFHRYLETVLPTDTMRTRLAQEGAGQASPEDSLLALRHTLANATQVTEGLLRAPRVPFRIFYATSSLVQREIAHNAFFNPLSALEFRPEFDRIKSPEVLEVIRSGPRGRVHHFVALTFLSLFRMLRYLRLLGRIVAETGKREMIAGRAYLVLSVLRSDARALSDYLKRRAGHHFAESYERMVLAVPARDLKREGPALRAEAHRLVAIRSALEGIAGSLRLEMRRAFLHDLPAPDTLPSDQKLRKSLELTIDNVRPALRNSILFLGRALGVSLEEGGVFDDQAARRETSERLRRDVWMFGQIVRAFYTKAQYSEVDDRWATIQNFQYVREFLAYFRAMGYPLLRVADYPRFDAFIFAVSRLEDTDLVDPARLERAIDECMAFHGYLQQLFDDISRREVLEGVVFDRRNAAGALKLYLGDVMS
ncbi:MAG TPA: hypothetical protein VHE30_19125 [Polyangiaceae bacterium]|nr:hypothetical protein [Polyangiaceae bacterium]